jgi:hypothetical protein
MLCLRFSTSFQFPSLGLESTGAPSSPLYVQVAIIMRASQMLMDGSPDMQSQGIPECELETESTAVRGSDGPRSIQPLSGHEEMAPLEKLLQKGTCQGLRADEVSNVTTLSKYLMLRPISKLLTRYIEGGVGSSQYFVSKVPITHVSGYVPVHRFKGQWKYSMP